MKIIFFGTPDFVVPVLKLLNENFEVIAIVTAPDKRGGVAEYAQKHHIPVLAPSNFNHYPTSSLQLPTTDLFILAAYGKLLPQNLLDIPKFGALNIHPSLLPKYRGPSPIQAAVLNGEKISGVTIIKMDEKMDHGPIISAKEINISNQDNFDTLSKKMFEEGAKLLVEVIPSFVFKKIKPKEQNHQEATFTKIIKKEDGYFEIDSPPNSEQLDKMIRAYYPWPTAWTRWNGKIVKLLPHQMIQMEGKKAVRLEDFLRGYPNFPIKNF